MARFTDRQQTPSRPPTYQPPRVRQPRQPADPALQQRSWAGLALAVLSLIGMTFVSGNVRRGAVAVGVALIIAGVALWLSISSMSRARRAGSGRPRGAVFATILGTAACVFAGFVLLGFAMFWPQLTRYSTCMSGANTVTAQQACRQQLTNSVGNQFGVLRG